MMMNDASVVARFLLDHDDFVIVGHVNPDGDCLGSIFALTAALRSVGKTVAPVVPEGIPEMYKFLTGSDTALPAVPVPPENKTAVIVDCENFERVGVIAENLARCENIVEIDHHPGKEGRKSNVRLIDAKAASCGQIILSVLKETNIPITRDIADCLLTAIVTDTGSFRFPNVTPETLRASADLLEAGASISRISQRIFEARSLSSLKLLGSTLSNMRTAFNDTVAYATVSREDIAASGGSDSETEGLVNYVRSAKGINIAILLREEDDGTTKVSLRSRDGSDISQVARMFGGGGHKAAAGCTIQHQLAESVNIVLDAIGKWMGS